MACKAPRRLKAAGERQVCVQYQRGNSVPLRTTYYRRRQGDARHREKGLFPAFAVLGIHEHASPAATARMARSACAVASLEEAAAWPRARRTRWRNHARRLQPSRGATLEAQSDSGHCEHKLVC